MHVVITLLFPTLGQQVIDCLTGLEAEDADKKARFIEFLEQ